MSSVLESDKTRYLVVDKQGILTAPPQSEVARVDSMSRPAAEAFARRMARYREANPGEITADTDATSVNNRDLRLTELLGIPDLDTYDREELWTTRRWNPGLDVPLGTLYKDGIPTGTPFIKNIATGDTGGEGPHWPLQGQTGSGKSMFLEDLVISLAAWHPPEKLNFMIIDFKGEASFLGFRRLPHVTGIVNDTGDPEILDRLAATILGEIERRKRFMAAEQARLGIGLPDVGKYLYFRENGYDLEPLPILIVLIDEAFIFYDQYKSEFSKVFTHIAKQGRSVGVWLMLASQELGFLQGQQAVWSEMNFTASLAVRSDTLSRVVLGGRDDAWEENIAKRTKNYTKGGHLFLKFAGSDPVHVRAANNLLEYKKTRTATAHADVATAELVAYTLANNFDDRPDGPDRADGAATAPNDVARADDGRIRTENSEIEVLLKKLSMPVETQLHNLWTPPLRKTVTFAQLSSYAALQPAAGPHDLTIPIGIVDHPWDHTQSVLSEDFTTNAGSVVVAGTAKSGRSTALTTMIIASSFRFAPHMVSWLLLDQGGDLGIVRCLPNVAGYARQGNSEMRDRILSEIQRIITLRSRLFALHDLNSIREYFHWRDSNPQPADPYGYLFVAIDGWLSLKAQLNNEDMAAAGAAVGWLNALGSMIEAGPNNGVHFVITTDNSAYDLPAVAQKSVSPIYLRGAENMSDAGPTAKQILKNYPVNQPGLTIERATLNGKDKYEVLRARIAVPIPQDIPEPTVDQIEVMIATDHSAAIKELCEGINAAAQPDQRIPVLRPLPTDLSFAQIWKPWCATQHTRPRLPGRPQRNVQLPLGLNSVDMTTIGIPWSPDPQDTSPHTLILGRPQSGRTTTLTTLITGILGSFAPQDAKIVILDERGALNRQRRLLAKEHYLAAHADRERTDKVLTEVLAEMHRRIGTNPDLHPTEEEQQTYFTGPELYLIVDNIDFYKNNQGSSPHAARLLSEIIRIRQRVGVHVLASTTHENFVSDSQRSPDNFPLAALEESRAHIISLAAANRIVIRDGIRSASFLVPGRANLISDRVEAAANGKPPIIQIASATTT